MLQRKKRRLVIAYRYQQLTTRKKDNISSRHLHYLRTNHSALENLICISAAKLPFSLEN